MRGPAAVAEALNLLANGTPTLAVIDIARKDGPCTESAGALRRRGAAFLVHAEPCPDEPLGDAFRGVSWIGKPVPHEDVVAALQELPGPGAAGKAAVSGWPLRLDEAAAGTGNPVVRKLERFAALSDAERPRGPREPRDASSDRPRSAQECA